MPGRAASVGLPSPNARSQAQNDTFQLAVRSSEDHNVSTSSNLSNAEQVSDTSVKVSEGLLDFILQTEAPSEPPRKRQKVTATQDSSEPNGAGRATSETKTPSELSYIVVSKTDWDIRLPGLSLSGIALPKTRHNIRPVIQWDKIQKRPFIRIFDGKKDCVFQAAVPESKSGFDDLLLSLEVDSETKKWSKAQGRLWTEFDVELICKDGLEFFRLVFTIKWNVTASPYEIPGATIKPKSLLKVLERHFPDQNIGKVKKWTPQDFYQSVHVPDKRDEIPSMKVPGLETNLYPFQKRAVQWLLRKEGVELSSEDGHVRPAALAVNSELPISFISCVDADHRPCYVSHLFGVVTLDIEPFRALEQGIRGGILAEEMGLGKTVEMISLIALHRRLKETAPVVFDAFTGTPVRPSAATLIITPPSILKQWVSEINRHSPGLKVIHYMGVRDHDKLSPSELLDLLADSDVVVTTYAVLAAEIHFTQLNPEKTLRREPKYPRPKSPLMQLSWFRICIDEAQMIESGVSNAAVVARMIPRVNAWCITGTPVRKDINDLLGLLIFLRYNPYAYVKHTWVSLITSHKEGFRRLFGTLALRHSKQSVREELKLPAQRRYVITMPFTPIEEQHYQELFNQMCEDSGLDPQGAPLADNWDPDAVSDVMRTWLVRLRQTALHPEVGGRNRRALGHKDGPLRTVDQVLDVMMEQSDAAIRADQRSLLTSKLKRGQLFENSPRVKEALEIWQQAVDEASAIVDECRAQLKLEIEKSQLDGASIKASEDLSPTGEESSDDLDEVDPSSRLGVFRNRLRGALEIQHMAVFFRANAYFQIKTNTEMTQPDSPEFGNVEKLETEGYDEAKRLRREILQEIHRKADKLMRTISRKTSTQTFVQVPEFPTNPPKGGLESRRIMEHLDALATALDLQANHLDEWREKTIQFLLRPLVDEDEEIEVTGDEYEESTKTQDEVMVFVQALRAVIADRFDALTGQENKLVEHECKTTLRMAKDDDGPFPERTIALLSTRQQIKPAKILGSMRGIVTELRLLATSLRFDAENGNTRAQNELSIVEKQLSTTQKQLSEQIKAITGLEKEIELFTSVMNTRLEYYRQLQQVSDMVAPYEGANNEKVVAKMLEDEEKLSRKIATGKSKRRYLVHLRTEASNPEEQRICVICRESFEIGALTVCGHQYCKECIRLWWSSHHNCPICKRKLIQADLHEITYKPQELIIHAEEVHDATQQRASPISLRKSSIYSEISKAKLAEIKNIELEGRSFTTKVDTLARHLIWLRESDPGAKSIIYSQFKDFLDVLALAFERFRIGCSSIDKQNGIEKFKKDPSVECFLLHSRAHSSGLNLVNASHVFLCEPLLNTALELQAIARVDRIGQHQETNVWLYLVDGTVEESIHQLSVRRRMEHMGQTLSHERKGKSREMSPMELSDKKLEEANSMELQQASLAGLLAKGGKAGEMVEQKDLWECLFGSVESQASRREKTINDSELTPKGEVVRYLRAEAAEERIVSVE